MAKELNNLLVFKDKHRKFTEYTWKQDGKNSVISLSVSSSVWEVCQKNDYSDICQISEKWCFQLLFRNISWDHKWLESLCPQYTVGFFNPIKEPHDDEQQILEEEYSILLNTASQQIQSHIFLSTHKTLFVSITDNRIWYSHDIIDDIFTSSQNLFKLIPSWDEYILSFAAALARDLQEDL